MSKYFIDFTVFQSPTEPYARVCGEVDLSEPISVGSIVSLRDANDSLIIRLPVQYTAGAELEKNLVFGLEDVVVEAREEANQLCLRLQMGGLDYEPFSEE
jgi:hypothetical protein